MGYRTRYSGLGPTALQEGAGRAFKSAGYYTGMMCSNDTTGSLTQNFEYAIRFEVGASTAFDLIGVEVTTGAGSAVIRLGIRRDNGSGYPGALFHDAGTVDASSPAFVSTAITQTLTPGRWWLTATLQTATGVSVRCRTIDPFIAAASGATANVGCYNQGSVSGALPASFSSTLSMTANAPKIMMRAA